MSLVAAGYGSGSETEEEDRSSVSSSSPSSSSPPSTSILLARSLPSSANLSLPDQAIIVQPTGPQNDSSSKLHTLSPDPDDHPFTLGEDDIKAREKLLRPPPLPGLDLWGIPPATETPCPSDLQAKVAKLHRLAGQGVRFNDRLWNNRSFKNPKLHAELIAHANIDEYGSHLTSGIPGIFDPPSEAYADRIVQAQREKAAAAAAAQASRTPSSTIAFTHSSSAQSG